MTVINSNSTKEFELFRIIYQLHALKDKISFFERKYNIDFNEFENSVKNSKDENFEIWDDYIAWKANQKLLTYLTSQKQDIESGNFSIS